MEESIPESLQQETEVQPEDEAAALTPDEPVKEGNLSSKQRYSGKTCKPKETLKHETVGNPFFKSRMFPQT